MTAMHVSISVASYFLIDELTDLVVVQTWIRGFHQGMMVLAIENESVGRTRDSCLLLGALLLLELWSIVSEKVFRSAIRGCSHSNETHSNVVESVNWLCDHIP